MSFLPLDLTSTESLETIVSHVDYVMQYGEDEEPKEVSVLFSDLPLCRIHECFICLVHRRSPANDFFSYDVG